MKYPIAFLMLLPGLVLAQGMNPTSPVVLDEARLTEMAPTMQVSGTVISRSSAFLSAEVEGRLRFVADVGTRVAAGDVVAEIEDTALLLQAQELQAEIQRAGARTRFLQAELARLERLAETNLAAVSQIEQVRSERDVAESDLVIAGSRLEQTQDRIDRTRIRAPFDGVVTERVAQAGERMSTGERVLRMVDPDSLEVVAHAPLDYYAYVRPSDELGVLVGQREIVAPVRTLVSVGDQARHVFELRLDMAERLPVGQTVRVVLPMADVREVLAVPRDALVLRGDGISVFIVDEDNKARRIRVTTGIGSGELIEVHGPIQAGDRVVVRGNERLRPGQDVMVREG